MDERKFKQPEPWTGSLRDYVKSVAGMFLLAAVMGAWAFALMAIGGGR
jgi:hypothetical protein